MNEETETKTRKKNGAHTNSCTTVQLDEHNIHVGCCLFSHNPVITTKKKNKMRSSLVGTHLCFGGSFDLIYNETKKKKKTEHTRIVAQLCSSRNAIFTSVVVYSRTNKTIKTIKKNSNVCNCY